MVTDAHVGSGVRPSAPALRAEIRQEQLQQHRQMLSSIAVQTIAMLGRSQLAVDRLVMAAAEANPALVVTAPRRCRWCAGALRSGICPRCSGSPHEAPDPGVELSRRDEIAAQARLLVGRAAAGLVDTVIDALDDRGLLATPVPLPSWATDADLVCAVQAVATAGPPGTAAPDTLTCLRRQAEWHVAHGAPPLVTGLLGEHLRLLDAADPVAAAAAAGLDPTDVRAGLEFLRRRLTPAPLPRSADRARPAAPPDVVITVTPDGDLAAAVLGAADLGLGIDPGGADDDPAVAAWWRSRVSDAESLLDLVDRRAAALRRVGTALTALQRGFILGGPAAHLPLTRTDLASRLGLHPSTVTRAVSAATVALPSGRIVAMAEFFGGAVAARAALASLLAGPNPPRTDAAAAAALAAAGHRVARRTVAKYRAELSRR